MFIAFLHYLAVHVPYLILISPYLNSVYAFNLFTINDVIIYTQVEQSNFSIIITTPCSLLLKDWLKTGIINLDFISKHLFLICSISAILYCFNFCPAFLPSCISFDVLVLFFLSCLNISLHFSNATGSSSFVSNYFIKFSPPSLSLCNALKCFTQSLFPIYTIFFFCFLICWYVFISFSLSLSTSSIVHSIQYFLLCFIIFVSY